MRKKTKYPGVYERDIVSRKGLPDVSFDIAFRRDGKLVWETVGRRSDGVNAVYASRIRGQRIDQIEKGTFVPKVGVPLFKLAVDRYAQEQLANKPSSKNTQGMLLHILPVIGDVPMDKVRFEHIERIVAGMRTAGRAPQTIQHVVAFVRRIFTRARAWGVYAGKDPTEGVKLPKVDSARLRYLTEAEATQLLEVLKARTPQWHDIACVSLYSGLRLREVLGLRVESLNFDAKVIYVLDAKSGTRVAYMTDAVLAILKSRAQEKAKQDFIFQTFNGGQIRNISTAFVRAADELFNVGVTDRRYRVVFHTLRHTFGSWLAQRGVPLYTIAELMGHSSLEMTKRYSKLSPDTKQAALKLLPTIGISGDAG